jgi:phage terminase large subunit-like protein
MKKSRKEANSTSNESELYYFDAEAAQRPIEFITSFCTHVKGDLVGKPIIPLPWEQERVIKPFYGTKRISDGLRRYRTLYVQVPRKNNKTTLVACLKLYNFFGFNVTGFESYAAASDREQASILFSDIIKPMIEANVTLRNACEIYKRVIVRKKTGGVMKVLASDGPRLHGFNADDVAIDELWALMTGKQEEAINALVTSVASKAEPIIFQIGTPGYDKNSAAYRTYQYAKKVLSGDIKDDSFLPVIYEADESDDPFEEETWKKANPGYGYTVKIDYLRDAANKARQNPSQLNVFKRLHLGMWTKSETVFIPSHVWDLGDKGRKTIQDFAGKDCWVGIDLANYNDLLPVCFLFHASETEIEVIVEYWVTEEKANDRKSKNEIDYINWANLGYVHVTPGNVADYQLIRKRINEVAGIVNIKKIGYDDWNASQFALDLTTDGHITSPWSPRNFKLWHKPTQTLEAMATAGNIRHGGNPVLAWNVENVVIRYNGEYIKPDKALSRDKIDGVVALIVALGEWMNRTNDPDVHIEILWGS